MRDEMIELMEQHCPLEDCTGRAVRNCFECMTDHLIANGATLIHETGIEDMSDGYHTFRDLYYQRMMLTAVM